MQRTDWKFNRFFAFSPIIRTNSPYFYPNRLIFGDWGGAANGKDWL